MDPLTWENWFQDKDVRSIVWGVYIRFLGFVYMIALSSLWNQIIPIAGSRGYEPVQMKLRKIKEDFGSWRFVYFPTLLWVDSSDLALRNFLMIGIFSSAMVVLGVLSPLFLAIAWLIWQSLHIAAFLIFPWDALLSEAGFQICLQNDQIL